MHRVGFDLVFNGNRATRHEIDFYDVSRSLIGFQRSLAITTHAIINNEVITQAPALKNAEIILLPAEQGSWKTRALVGFGGILIATGSASKDSMFGYLMHSAMDYVISESLGFHVDYDKTILKSYEEAQKVAGVKKYLTQGRMDSVVEKCEIAIRDIHRPMAFSHSANSAKILFIGASEQKKPVGPKFDLETYDYMLFEVESAFIDGLIGKVSSYNSNTFKGRVYVASENRAVPFELADTARSTSEIRRLVSSLSDNSVRRVTDDSIVEFSATKILGRSGGLKRYIINSVRKPKEI